MITPWNDCPNLWDFFHFADDCVWCECHADEEELKNRRVGQEPNWQPVICPNCNGKGVVTYTEYEEDDGYGDQEYVITKSCSRCDGKHFIKINVNDLNS